MSRIVYNSQLCTHVQALIRGQQTRPSIIRVIVTIICSVAMACEPQKNDEAFLSGTVYDNATNASLTNVLVQLRSSTDSLATARTDQDGVYSIRQSLIAGEQYTLQFTLAGYDDAVVTQTLSAGINRYDVPLKRSDCSLIIEPTVINVSTDKIGSQFVIRNSGSTTCSYSFSLVNNGTTESRPVVSISPDSDRSGIVGASQRKAISFSVNRQNFNADNTAEQTISIVENSDEFAASIVVERDLGCNGCNTINAFGGACSSQVTCSGCCSPDNQCLAGPCPSCTDNVRNQNEEDVDCGGPCPSCGTCSDNIRNQNEEDVDCGGPCPSCGTCSDNIRNQGEDNVDCGGPCPACAPSAAQVSLELRPSKNFRFTWTQSPEATFYRLLESDNTDATGTYSTVADNISTNERTHNYIVNLVEKKNKHFRVQSCNELSCVDSTNTVTVDSIVPAIGYIKADNSDVDDRFGHSIALSRDGTTLVVGAPHEDGGRTPATRPNGQTNEDIGNSGAVYVFTRRENTWTQQAYIKAKNADRLDVFGTQVAISADGTTIAVSTHLEDSEGQTINGDSLNNNAENSGAVYIYVRNTNGVWEEQAFIKASNSEAYDLFGIDISLSNDGHTLAVGATGEDSSSTEINVGMNDNSGNSVGAVYVFARDNGVWSEQSYIKPQQLGDEPNQLLFGSAVTLSGNGDVLAVSAPSYDLSTVPNSGIVYVYSRDSNSVWTFSALKAATNSSIASGFGSDISISDDGTTMAVGALGDNKIATGINDYNTTETRPLIGACYVYSLDSNQTWAQRAYIKPSYIGPEENYIHFGHKVSLSGDGNTLLVGSRFEDSSSIGINGDETNKLELNSGAAYLYKRNGDGWYKAAYIKASNTSSNDEFSSDVALSKDGSTIAVSSEREDSQSRPDENQRTDSGAIYIY